MVSLWLQHLRARSVTTKASSCTCQTMQVHEISGQWKSLPESLWSCAQEPIANKLWIRMGHFQPLEQSSWAASNKYFGVPSLATTGWQRQYDWLTMPITPIVVWWKARKYKGAWGWLVLCVLFINCWQHVTCSQVQDLKARIRWTISKKFQRVRNSAVSHVALMRRTRETYLSMKRIAYAHQMQAVKSLQGLFQELNDNSVLFRESLNHYQVKYWFHYDVATSAIGAITHKLRLPDPEVQFYRVIGSSSRTTIFTRFEESYRCCSAPRQPARTKKNIVATAPKFQCMLSWHNLLHVFMMSS